MGVNRRSFVFIVLAILATVPLNYPLREDARFWATMVWVCFTSCLWGLYKAIKSYRWTREQERLRPALNYASAKYSGVNHMGSHTALLMVQTYQLFFAIYLGLQPSSSPTTMTRTELVFTLVLLLEEGTLIGLNFWLIYRRSGLVRSVWRHGGD